MSERKEGWYWVQYAGQWIVSEFDGLEFTLDHGPIERVGPRIPTPDEPWQCVPKEPTEGMVNAGFWAVGNEQRVDDLWADLLSAAPKPGEL